MPRNSYISVLGLYNYDATIFDNLVVPSEIDKDTLIYNIILECAELETIYPNADFFKQVVGMWSKSRQRTWEMLQKVLYKDYDPFINITRDEVRTIEQVRDLQGTNDTTLEQSATAFNSTTYQGTNKDTNTSATTDTGTINTIETLHIEGDSAITDAQDVAIKEYNLRVRYDLYRYIINDFKQRFCLGVY